jgi:hypothetical protein
MIRPIGTHEFKNEYSHFLIFPKLNCPYGTGHPVKTYFTKHDQRHNPIVAG